MNQIDELKNKIDNIEYKFYVKQRLVETTKYVSKIGLGVSGILLLLSLALNSTIYMILFAGLGSISVIACLSSCLYFPILNKKRKLLLRQLRAAKYCEKVNNEDILKTVEKLTLENGYSAARLKTGIKSKEEKHLENKKIQENKRYITALIEKYNKVYDEKDVESEQINL